MLHDRIISISILWGLSWITFNLYGFLWLRFLLSKFPEKETFTLHALNSQQNIVETIKNTPRNDQDLTIDQMISYSSFWPYYMNLMLLCSLYRVSKCPKPILNSQRTGTVPVFSSLFHYLQIKARPGIEMKCLQKYKVFNIFCGGPPPNGWKSWPTSGRQAEIMILPRTGKWRLYPECIIYMPVTLSHIFHI